MNCTKCGAEVQTTDVFCGACGTPVAAAQAAPPTQPPPAFQPPPPPPAGAAPLAYGASPQSFAPPAYGAAPAYGAPPVGAPPMAMYGPPRFVDPKTGVPLAEWWQRAVALLLDGLIVGIPGVIVLVIFSSIDRKTTLVSNGFITYTQTTSNGAYVALGFVFFYALWFAYYVLLNGGPRGQTVGKMALGIATRGEDGTSRLGYGRAAVRWLIVLLCSLGFGILLLLDYLSPLWDSRRQAWHDHAAKSVVIPTR